MLDMSSKDGQQESWDLATSRRIGKEIRRLRGRRSAQDLADRTEALGYPIGRATISELETGRRKTVAVSELLILAAALDVPPIMLLCPGLPDGRIEILPGYETTAAIAAEWFEGSDEAVQLRMQGGDDTVASWARADMRSVRKFVQASRQLRSLELLIHLKDQGVEHLQDTTISPEDADFARAELNDIAVLLRDRGYTVNPLSRIAFEDPNGDD